MNLVFIFFERVLRDGDKGIYASRRCLAMSDPSVLSIHL